MNDESVNSVPEGTQNSVERREVWISAALLCVIAPFMAEVLSSNVSPLAFLALSWGLIPVYGFPILLVREWAMRCGVSLPGLLLAGFGYGFFNEGLIAKTLFLNHKVPWNLFDGHVGWGGVNWGWLLVICAYHSLFAVVTPLLLIEKLRPQTAGQPWLSVRSTSVLFSAILLISTTYFSQKPLTDPRGFWLLWAAIAATVVVGSFWRGAWSVVFPAIGTRRLVWLGAFFLPMLLVCSGAFAHGLPWPLFVVGWSIVVLVSGYNATRSGADGCLALGLGAYAGMSMMNVIVAHPIAKIVGVFAFSGIVWGLRKHKSAFTLFSTRQY